MKFLSNFYIVRNKRSCSLFGRSHIRILRCTENTPNCAHYINLDDKHPNENIYHIAATATFVLECTFSAPVILSRRIQPRSTAYELSESLLCLARSFVLTILHIFTICICIVEKLSCYISIPFLILFVSIA